MSESYQQSMGDMRRCLDVAVARLPVCTHCGQPHTPRVRSKGFAPSWVAEDGHAYTTHWVRCSTNTWTSEVPA